MVPMMTKPAVKYVATVHGSREVTLFGMADLAYWENKLAVQNLTPYAVDGQAEIMVSAVASKYMGIRFSEFIIAITVADEPGGEAAGAFLLSAYTTSRMFAFVERNIFQTPYTHGFVEVRCEDRPFVRLSLGPDQVFRIERNAKGVSPAKDATWDGPIYLPNPDRNQASTKRMFARLSGATEICPFVEREDNLILVPTAMDSTFGWLAESGFAPKEWHIRHNATHARSKTYARS